VWLALAGVAVAAGLLGGPLLAHAPRLPDGNDVLFAIHAGRGFAEALAEGTLWPRWLESSSAGLGAPIFVFYPPAAYYAVAGLSAVFGGVVPGLSAAFLVLGALAGVTFVLAFRRDAGGPALAAGGALFVLAPYHALDLYWRTALAEYAAFVWIPLLLVTARRAVEGRGADGVAGFALACAGLAVTHVVTAVLAVLALAPYAGVHLARSGRWGRAAPLAAGGLLAGALAAAYLVPLAAQRDLVQLDWARESPYGDFRRNFVGRDEVRLGYDPAPIGPWVDRAAGAQALLAAAALASYALARRGATSRDAGRRGTSRDDEVLAHAALSAWVLLLQLPASEPLWRAVPGLATAQFPWRFQIFQATSACALVTLALSTRGRHGALPRLLCAAGALPGLVLAAQVATRADLAVEPGVAEAPGVRRLVMREYLPRGAPPPRALPRGLPPARLVGGGRVRVQRWAAHERVVRTASPRDDLLLVRTFHYPGWSARVDGAPVAARPHPVPARGRGAESAVLLAVAVPAGEHTVRLRFEPTGDRALGAAATAAGALVLAGLVAARRRTR